MKVLSIQQPTTVNNPTKIAKVSFGHFNPSKINGAQEILIYLAKNDKQYSSSLDAQIEKHMGSSLDSSDIRDAIFYKALAHGAKLMKKAYPERSKEFVQKTKEFTKISKKLNIKAFIDTFVSVFGLKNSKSKMPLNNFKRVA
jgi:hypothetical protein